MVLGELQYRDWDFYDRLLSIDIPIWIPAAESKMFH